MAIRHDGNKYTALELAKWLVFKYGADAIVDMDSQVDEGITPKESQNLEAAIIQQSDRVKKMLRIDAVEEKVRSRNGGNELDEGDAEA